jgi:hypothetical protein
MDRDLLLLLTAFGFGVTLKVADLVADDGVRLFRGDRYLFGLLWGLFGAGLIWQDFDTACVYAALLAYWVYRRKLDDPGHQLGGTILLVAVISRNLAPGVGVVAALVLFYAGVRHLKEFIPCTGFGRAVRVALDRYRLHFLLAPAVLAVIRENPRPVLAVAANMVGVLAAWAVFAGKRSRVAGERGEDRETGGGCVGAGSARGQRPPGDE